MIFLSLRVTAAAEGGLKGPARPRRSLRGLGGVSHQQARAGYIPAHCLPLPTAHIIRNKEPIALWPPTQFHRSTFTINILSYDTFHHIAFFHFLMIIAALI